MGEGLLGIPVVYIILLAVDTVHWVGKGKSHVEYDNKATLYNYVCKFEMVPTGASSTNVQRLLRKIKTKYIGNITLNHVNGH